MERDNGQSKGEKVDLKIKNWFGVGVFEIARVLRNVSVGYPKTEGAVLTISLAGDSKGAIAELVQKFPELSVEFDFNFGSFRGDGENQNYICNCPLNT